jgi:hypothetical protein
MKNIEISRDNLIVQLESIDYLLLINSEHGPIILKQKLGNIKYEFDEKYDTLENYKMNLVINSLIAFGQGHQSISGTCEIPSRFHNYRILTISKNLPNEQSQDLRLRKSTMVQILIFIPISLYQYFPNTFVIDQLISSHQIFNKQMNSIDKLSRSLDKILTKLLKLLTISFD